MNGRQLIALLLIVFGALLLVGNISGIDTGRLFWPLLLVVGGLVLILRPQSVFSPGIHYRGLGGMERYGQWDVNDEDIRMFVGEVDLDFEDANLADGVTTVQVSAFVSDTSLRVPADVGLRLVSNAFVTSASVNGDKHDYVMSNMRYESDNYPGATKQLNINFSAFVNDLTLRHR